MDPDETVNYGVIVTVHSTSSPEEKATVTVIKAMGPSDEAAVVRAVQSFTQSVAAQRSLMRPVRPLDMTPWWRK